MKHVRNIFAWYNSADRDVLSASILGAAMLAAAAVLVIGA